MVNLSHHYPLLTEWDRNNLNKNGIGNTQQVQSQTLTYSPVSSRNISPIPPSDQNQYTWDINTMSIVPTSQTATNIANGINSGSSNKSEAELDIMRKVTENEAIRNDLYKEYLGLEKDKYNFNRDASIASGTFQAFGALTNAGLGIWNAYNQNKNAAKQRDLMDAQIKNYNENIEASREARQQRRDEIARLGKMRTNTKAQFNTQATVTRSY